MEEYFYFTLGIILGIAIALYFYGNRKEKIQKQFEMDRKLFSTEELDQALEKAVDYMQQEMKNKKRELTNQEKNKIIFQCLNEKERLDIHKE